MQTQQRLLMPNQLLSHPFTPLMWKTHEDPPRSTTRILPKTECHCINEAIRAYAQVWVKLQSGDMSAETALSKLSQHLECTDHCDRWEDCENLLRFIDQEIATQRAATEHQKED